MVVLGPLLGVRNRHHVDEIDETAAERQTVDVLPQLGGVAADHLSNKRTCRAQESKQPRARNRSRIKFASKTVMFAVCV